MSRRQIAQQLSFESSVIIECELRRFILIFRGGTVVWLRMSFGTMIGW